MSYRSEIENIEHLTVDDIINASRANISAANSARPWKCQGLDHGTAILSSEEQLCCYMAAYGKMHEAKLKQAFSKFPTRELNEDIEIIDWGCGQGIASIALINQLEAWGAQGKLKKTTLIEPSSKALERAELNVTTRLKDTEVVVDVQNVFLPSFNNSGSTLESLHIEEPICIHLFSNILDIAAIDLKQLATIVAQTGYRHYFICVGPMNVGNERIEAFSRYFAIPSSAGESGIFVNERHPQFDRLSNGKWFGCVAKGFKMIRMEGKPFLVPLSYYPPKEFLASYRLDAFDSDEKDKWRDNSAFAVLAPFDIGASVYSDVDPVLAVLNNIVTRGLPTKCSPFIESKIAEIFEATEMKSQYGSINFEVSNQATIDKYRYYLEKVPVGVAWIQKTLIEAAITGRLPLDEGKLTVVVKEDVCPCAALALPLHSRTSTRCTTIFAVCLKNPQTGVSLKLNFISSTRGTHPPNFIWGIRHTQELPNLIVRLSMTSSSTSLSTNCLTRSMCSSRSSRQRTNAISTYVPVNKLLSDRYIPLTESAISP